MKSDIQIFNRLDKAFWMVWGAIPFIVGIRVYFLFTSAYFNAEGSVCGGVPILEFSLVGKILACAFLGLNIILYLLLLGYMHMLIRQFRRGSLFVDGTLKYMQRIALLLLAWPFLRTVLFNLTSYILFALGDVSDWKLQYGFDLTLIATGMVILALRLVMSHAIKLHQDAQYTV